MSSILLLSVHEGASSTRVTAAGRLDQVSAEKLRKTMRECAKHDAREVVLEMGEVDYLDSMAMGAILSCRLLLENNGKTLVLAGPKGLVLEALHIAKFQKLFEIR